MISKCEQCQNYNWRKMQTIIDAYKDAGIPRPKHIWCQDSNRPEDIRETICDRFKPFEIIARSHETARKPRYCNNSHKLSGVRKIKAQKAVQR